MSLFLLRFSRYDPDSPPVIERYEDPDVAMVRFQEEERRLRGRKEFGVVLLVAEDEEDLVKTHGHYFKSIGQLLEPA